MVKDNLSNKPKLHKHRYYDTFAKAWVERDCRCDTGQDHTTPKNQ